MKKVLVIAGPTASGKTALSIKLAQYFKGEIISGDSTQVYKELEIGTAKITEIEKENIPHYGLDLIHYHENYSVKDFQTMARHSIDEISAKQKLPIIVGGTGFYLKACLYDYEFTDELEEDDQFDELSNQEIYDRLNQIDPKSLEKIHLNNRKRLIRALNIGLKGQSKSEREEAQKHKPIYDIFLIVTDIEKKEELNREQTQLFNVNHYPENNVSKPIEIKEENNDFALSNQTKTENTIVTSSIKKDRHPTFPHLDLIGQMHGRYILASSEDDLYVIDQHAAKERINYELILEQLNQNQDQFDLLIPIEIECSSAFMERFNEFKQILDSLHLHIEPFSLKSYIVRSIPLWLNQNDLTRFMQDVMDRFLSESKINQEILRESVIATMACHRSIRFNQALTPIEMRHIIEELSVCKQPYHCPHGRPTLVKQNAQSLWKDFER